MDKICWENSSPYLKKMNACPACICGMVALDRCWPRGQGTSPRENSYTHDSGQTAVNPFICSTFTEMSKLAAMKMPRPKLVYVCRCGCKFISSQHRGEWQSSDQLKPRRFKGGWRTPWGEEAAQKIPKAGPKQRLNPFMWGLFSCCEWQMHVWTPSVSKCLFTGSKSAASKLKDLKAAAHCAVQENNPSQTFLISFFQWSVGVTFKSCSQAIMWLITCMLWAGPANLIQNFELHFVQLCNEVYFFIFI